MTTSSRTIGVKDHSSDYELAISDKGAAHILIEDNTEQIINGYLVQSSGGVQFLGADAVIDSYEITMVGGHTFVAGDFIVVAGGERLYQGQVVSVATNVLTLDTPLDFAFLQASSVAFEVINDLGVDGSVTRQTFKIDTTPDVTKNIHFRGLRVSIMGSGSMDDGKFGDLAALSRGLVFRLVKNDGTRFNYVNVKTNGDLGLAFDHKVYTSKGAGGDNSVEFTWQIAQDDGVVMELEPGDAVEAIVQDDLSSLDIKVWIFGHLES